MISLWSLCTTGDLQAVDKTRSAVLLPVAATEQHGPHLPVGTDALILEELLQRLRTRVELPGYHLLIAPVMAIGKSNEHLDFPGTLSLSTSTFYGVLMDVCRSIRKHGFTKVILMNSHGGNTDLLNVVARDARIDLDLEMYVIDWWFTDFWNACLDEIQDSGEYGVFHACELETSIMLAVRPESLRMDRAADEYPPETLRGDREVTLKGPVQVGWKTRDVSEKGVIGAPTLASAEKGEILLDYAVHKLEKILMEILQHRYVHRAGGAVHE